jgi:hypothetical protein
MPETEITAYSTADLLRIMGLTNPTVAQVNTAAAALISRMEAAGKPHLAVFFRQAEEKIIDELEDSDDSDNEQADPTTQLGSWWEDQYLMQDDQQQADKTTGRRQKIQIFDNPHNVMKRERLGVSQVAPLPVAQGAMNPTLRNITTRTVLIDSQFRQNIDARGVSDRATFGSTSSNVYNSTDYSVDLSEPLKNVVSITLYQVQIPVTWYAFSCAFGNVTYSLNQQTCTRTISEGNYSLEDILAGRMIGRAETNAEFYHGLNPAQAAAAERADAEAAAKLCEDQEVDFEGSGVFQGSVFDNEACQPKNLHALCFGLGGVNNNRLVNITQDIYVFYKPRTGLSDSGICGACPPNPFINQNLGWSLGFRPDTAGMIQAIPGEPAQAAPDLFGPKYFVVVLDDFNNNRLNQGIVSTINATTLTTLPNYATQPGPKYTPNTVPPPPGQGANVCRYKQTDPRRFTLPQLFTLNEILKAREPGGVKAGLQASRAQGPTSSDALGIVPLDGAEITTLRTAGLLNPATQLRATTDPSGAETTPSFFQQSTLLGGGAPYTKFGDQLSSRKREYFGPVDIERVRVKLVDDKGIPVDLNGLDWVISLHVEHLYQY